MVARIFASKGQQSRKADILKIVTIRDFSGGLNVIDNDLNLSASFAKELKNMQLGADGSNQVRPGTKLFAETSAILNVIVNLYYFNGFLIVVGKNGKIVSIDSVADVEEIWSDEYAKTLPGAPAGWVTTTFVSFAVFNGELIICNGVNKPLIVNTNMSVTYLNDPATGSNANTPIAKYVSTHGRYLLMAGDPDRIDRLYISSTDTSGVWVTDPAPNDAVNIDLGSRVPSGSAEIKGLGGFRNRLIVAFEEALLPGELGIFVSGDHLPDFTDAIEGHGAVSHRTIQTIGEDMLFTDFTGVTAVSRALFTGNVKPDRVSKLVDPLIKKDLARLITNSSLTENTFSVYDSAANNFMLFIPNADDPTQITKRRAFVRKRIKELKVDAWFTFEDWNFTAAARTALKRIFLTVGTQVYLLGSDTDPISADFVGDQETFDDGTVFGDGLGWTPVADVADSGIPISFVWELPWADNAERFLNKNSRYINFDTQGEGIFTAEMYTDNVFEDKSDLGEDFTDDFAFDDGFGWDVRVLDPALSMKFVGGDVSGFGLEGFGELFGGGRPTSQETLYAWTTKYKLFKLRMFGAVVKPLQFISVTMPYTVGSIRK